MQARTRVLNLHFALFTDKSDGWAGEPVDAGALDAGAEVSAACGRVGT
ncbi:hypothetical protein [Microbacterium sp. PMB16]